MDTRIGVVTFPGTLGEGDAARAVRTVGAGAVTVHADQTDLSGLAALILPDGRSYADRPTPGLRAAAQPVGAAIVAAAEAGLPVLGIGNGFHILCALGLLPGEFSANASGRSVCVDQWVRIDSGATAWTSRFDTGAEVLIPLRTAAGRYRVDEETQERLTGAGRIVARYAGDDPTGSTGAIAAVASADGRVVGMTVAPEYAIGPLTGPSDDGLGVFYSMLDTVGAAGTAS